MQCDIQFQGSKEIQSADLEFTKSEPPQVNYRGKTGFLNEKTLEVYKDNKLIVLWFTIKKPKGPIPM